MNVLGEHSKTNLKFKRGEANGGSETYSKNFSVTVFMQF